jgi:hypothetical protein
MASEVVSVDTSVYVFNSGLLTGTALESSTNQNINRNPSIVTPPRDDIKLKFFFCFCTIKNAYAFHIWRRFMQLEIVHYVHGPQ